MQAQLGPEAGDFFAALEEPAPTSLRLNPAKVSGSLPLPPVPWESRAGYLPVRPVFTLDPWWHAGAYYVQEASSMLLAAAWQVLPAGPKRILDLCGAPGGKSTHLASLMGPDDLLVANEVIRSRAHILAENLTKWGTTQAVVTQLDPARFGALPEFFDLLVVDAPCSGEGLFRKDPKAAAEWSPVQAQLCADRQRRILMDAWPALRPGGFLLYSTCTFNPAENEENLAWLAREAGAQSIALDLPDAWGLQARTASGMTGYQALPHQVAGEGFFFALLQKPGDSPAATVKLGKKQRPPLAARHHRHMMDEWLQSPDSLAVLQQKDLLRAVPAAQVEIFTYLIDQLSPLQAGLELAEVKKNDLRPSPALSLSPQLATGAFSRLSLNQEGALAFLKRDTPKLVAPAGWNLITFSGLGLGWIKAMHRRSNNYYPQPWRIRMPLPENLEGAFALADLVGE
jgi:16S rRNA C967 or C1407 C5-methylase (RsmB/RsmF family)/NOL1/NOP2/fmu family ribosome biogenesis protein